MIKKTDTPVQASRVIADLNDLTKFGYEGDEKGVNRPSFSPAYREAADWLCARMENAGLTVRMDAVGNIIGRAGPADKPAVVCGSHIDSVPAGGRFDGTLGVLAGLEVARCLTERNSWGDKALEIIAFIDEEGAYISLLGAHTMSGSVNIEEIKNNVGRNGEPLTKAMQRFGLNPANILDAIRPAEHFAAYVELHIEQGPVLECKNTEIGIVETIVGLQNREITFKGQACHAGTTPISMRQDALRAAADLISESYTIFANEFSDQLRITYGNIEVLPGATNVVPACVKVSEEIRASSEDEIAALSKRALEVAERVGKKYDVVMESVHLSSDQPAKMATHISSLIESACQELNCSYIYMPSGAGHDAQAMARLCDTGFIFVPSCDGLSHNPKEYTRDEHVEAGTKVLYKTLSALLEA